MIPVVVIDNESSVEERKERRVVLHIEPMTQEIDAHTSKYVEANEPGNVRQQNAISSDTDETVDGSVIVQMMEYRDSKLRVLLHSSLKEEEVLEADNYLHIKPAYFYDLMLPVSFNDANLKSLAILMHKYIVWGVLYDWYNQLGAAQARVYGAQLEDLEQEIKSDLYPAGYAKRPMQPFGPAKRFL